MRTPARDARSTRPDHDGAAAIQSFRELRWRLRFPIHFDSPYVLWTHIIIDVRSAPAEDGHVSAVEIDLRRAVFLERSAHRHDRLTEAVELVTQTRNSPKHVRSVDHGKAKHVLGGDVVSHSRFAPQ